MFSELSRQSKTMVLRSRGYDKRRFGGLGVPGGAKGRPTAEVKASLGAFGGPLAVAGMIWESCRVAFWGSFWNAKVLFEGTGRA